MKDIVEKLRKLEQTLATEQGPFKLFALFLREDAFPVWDVLVAADWIDRDRAGSLQAISKRVRESLGPRDIIKISRVVIIDSTDPSLKTVNSTIAIEHGSCEVQNSEFFGLPIKQGYIITSKLRPAA